MSRIDELRSLISLYEEYESELVAAIDELNRLTKN